ncbi:MAG: sigma factor-like helix-turn-helix DNA-binding protein [bacterium]|nr:sigma factor-like helix-turn-helix DNA-binding protein [bacterium]
MKPVGNVGPERLEKSVEIGTLYAFYGGLLTQKQQDALRLHYEEDLSLGEIAEELEVSRQNVHELISRSAQKLRKYEQALGGVSRARETAQALRRAQEMLESMHGLSDQDKRTADEAAALIAQVIRRQEGE